VKGLKPNLDASGMRMAIVVARSHDDIARRLLRGAVQALSARGAEQDAEVHWVPGPLEIPLVALQLAESSRFDAIVTLGCVLDGETPEFPHLVGECARGVMQVQLDTGVPISFGVLASFDRDQALARSGPASNRGGEAMEAAIEVVNLLRTVAEEDAAEE
jgi:6,7-dimethyl-8-ribityllumazine synthase